MLAISVTNNDSFKTTISETFRLLPIYTSRISLFIKLEIFKVNYIISKWAKKKKKGKKTNQTALMECSEKETIKSNAKAARILKAYLKKET